MITTLSIAEYRGILADFMRVFVFDPFSLLDIWALATFWIPGLLFVALIAVGLFRLRRPLLAVRLCIVLLGCACALWTINIASGILFIYAREAGLPGGFEDIRPLSCGIAYLVRGCLLLFLASVAVCQNLLFAGTREKRADARPEPG